MAQRWAFLKYGTFFWVRRLLVILWYQTNRTNGWVKIRPTHFKVSRSKRQVFLVTGAASGIGLAYCNKTITLCLWYQFSAFRRTLCWFGYTTLFITKIGCTTKLKLAGGCSTALTKMAKNWCAVQVVQSILTAIPNRPLEMVLSLMRGVIAKVTNVFPKLAAQLLKKIQ